MSAETLGGTNPPSGAEEPVGRAMPGPETSAEGFFSAEGDTLVPASF